MKRILRQNKEAVDQADAFLVSFSCGAGTQACRAATASASSLGATLCSWGTFQRSMDFVEKCSHCGACVIDDYGAICPVTRCAKGLLNGPCGGTATASVRSNRRGLRLGAHPRATEERGAREQRVMIHEPKDWNVIRRPGAVVERGPGKLKMGSEN